MAGIAEEIIALVLGGVIGLAWIKVWARAPTIGRQALGVLGMAGGLLTIAME